MDRLNKNRLKKICGGDIDETSMEQIEKCKEQHITHYRTICNNGKIESLEIIMSAKNFDDLTNKLANTEVEDPYFRSCTSCDYRMTCWL